MIDPYEDQEPSHDDSVKYCPNCETPNQFGEPCLECQREEQRADDLAQAYQDDGDDGGVRCVW